MATKTNITIDQGSDFSTSVNINDASGDPINLFGYTAISQIRKSYTSLTAVNFTVSYDNANSGSISLSLSSNAHSMGDILPTSRECVEIASKWFKIRVNSSNRTRICTYNDV